MTLASLRRARQSGEKQLAVLIDPDKTNRNAIIKLAELSALGGVSYFLWGGSLVNETQANYYLSLLRAHTKLPIVLFPGSIYQLSDQADSLLFLAMISGRNPELLIGQHVLAAPRIKKMNIEVIPTGYMYIDGGHLSSVGYMSNTQPIPADKPEIARATALAGIYLGHQVIYLDAGSGALQPVGEAIIRGVRQEIGDTPLIVGGGIRTKAQAQAAFASGADLIVVGNSLEENPDLLPELTDSLRTLV
ncbi:MAG: geranylgeranylglyceryl/heptaprenylglyceryl phosphate synthase [Bacteroidetes bacterium]|nr:MAG: geranylgeranylglyceryl/heptaprenylglyceryl phosphate synthase [Bacteroidota bacterium]